jgi:hypothetical protein
MMQKERMGEPMDVPDISEWIEWERQRARLTRMMKTISLLCASMLLGAAFTHGQSTSTPPAVTPPSPPAPTTPSASDADKTLNKAKREKQFSRIDKNSDTFVDREEFKNAKFAQKKPQRAEKRFARVDSNNDGKLSKDEWLAAPVRGKKKV